MPKRTARDGPNQGWSGDITKLRGESALHGVFLLLRCHHRPVHCMTVGWLSPSGGNAELAEHLFTEAVEPISVARGYAHGARRSRLRDE